MLANSLEIRWCNCILYRLTDNFQDPLLVLGVATYTVCKHTFVLISATKKLVPGFCFFVIPDIPGHIVTEEAFGDPTFK